ncbi:Rep [Chicken proventriculitis-associated circular virus 27]|nr:Rep [Chicken proventriculitis-associated circular virus 27]
MESPGICDTCERVIEQQRWDLFPPPLRRVSDCGRCATFRMKLEKENLDLQLQASRTRDDVYKQYLMTYPEMEKVPEWTTHYIEWVTTKDQSHKYQDAPPPPEVVWYVFTLTTNNNEHTRDNLLGAAKKLFQNGRTYKNEPIIKGAYCLEFTEAGRPHIHGIYTTGSERQLTDRSFQRAWKLWEPKKKQGLGHQGGFHQKATNAEKYNDYIKKGDGEGNEAEIFIKE